MAEKRMLSKVLSISKKFNLSLSDNFTRLLYVMLIPHSDDFGRLTGCPHKVKALVIPMFDEGWRDVEESLGKLHSAGLIHWYEASDDQYIQINNFDSHQQGLHKRTKSKFPDPPENSEQYRDIPSDSGNFPEIPPELNRTELNRTEGNMNGTETLTYASSIQNTLKEYSVTCKGVYELERLSSYENVIPIDTMIEAIKRSEGKGVGYVITVLEGMKNEPPKQSGKGSSIVARTGYAAHHKKPDPELEYRRREIALNQWIDKGNDPHDFVYRPD